MSDYERNANMFHAIKDPLQRFAAVNKDLPGRLWVRVALCTCVSVCGGVGRRWGEKVSKSKGRQ